MRISVDKMTEQQIQSVRRRYPAGTEHKYVFGNVQGITDLQSRSEQLADLVALFKLNEYQRDWVNQQLSELDGRRAELFAWSVRQELEQLAAAIKDEQYRNSPQWYADQLALAEEEHRVSERNRRDSKFGVKGYKTLKSAYADGWHEPDKDEYSWEDEMTLKGHFLVIGGKKAISMTAWSEKGYSLKQEAIMHPHASLHWQYGSYDVYRYDQVELIAKKDGA